MFGPFVYGLTYARTVGTFPKMIFIVACGVVTIAFILMFFVRIPKEDTPGLADDVEEQAGTGEAGPRLEREDTLVDAPEPLIVVDDEDRGRKIVKP